MFYRKFFFGLLLAALAGGLSAATFTDTRTTTNTRTITPSITASITRTVTPTGSPTRTPSPSPTASPLAIAAPVCGLYGTGVVAFYGGNSNGQLKDALGGPDLIEVGTVPGGCCGQPEGDAWLGTFFSGGTVTAQAWLEIPPSIWPGTSGAFEMKFKFNPGGPNNLFLIHNGADFVSVVLTANNYGLDCVKSSVLVAAPYGDPGLVGGQMYTSRLEWGAFGMRTLIDGVTYASTTVTSGWSSVTSIIIGAYPGAAFRDLISPVDSLAVLNDPVGVVCLGTPPITESPTATPSPTPTFTSTMTPSPTPTPVAACLGQYLLKWGSNGTGNGQFSDPFGTAVDPSGSVYVADWQNSRVQKFSSSGAYITQWGGLGAANGQFNQPTGIALDSLGNVYVSDTNNHRIQKFDPNGAYLATWGGVGSANGQLINPSGLAFDSSDDLYIVDSGNSRVQKFSSSGVYLTQWGSSGSGDGQFTGPQGVAVNSAGEVYVSEASNSRVQKFDPSGVFLSKWGTLGSGNGQFNRPIGLSVDPSGNVYVADSDNDRIQVFSSNGSYLSQWGGHGNGDSQFIDPYGVTVAPSGDVYVADALNHRIQKFGCSASTPTVTPSPTPPSGAACLGQYQLQWGSSGTGNGQLSRPEGVAVDLSGTVYVAEGYNNRIQKFNSSGFYMGQWGASGSGNGQFNSPVGVAVDSSRNVYVTDSGNNRIQKFDPNGTYLTQWGSNGAGNGQFVGAYGLAVDPSNNVYVADMGNNRIQKFTSSGVYLAQWGSGDAYTLMPAGVATNSAGEIFVTDLARSRVMVYGSSGALLRTWGSAGSGDGQFAQSYGIAVAPSGNVYVSDEVRDRIQEFSSNGAYLTQWGVPGTANSQFQSVLGIAADLSGNIYAADGTYNRIQKFGCSAGTPTMTPTATPIPSMVPSPVIDDYDDGNATGYSGGQTTATIDSAGMGGSVSMNFVSGSAYSGSSLAAHCNGHLIDTTAYILDQGGMSCTFIPGSGSIAYLPGAAPDHAISFSYKGDSPGEQIEFGITDVNGNAYSCTFSYADTAWHELTVYFPDVTDASLTPRLTPKGSAPAWSVAAAQASGCYFHVVGGADAFDNFGFAIDDLRFGQPESDSSPVQVAAALGVSVTQVQAAYNLQLDERLTWIVLRLAAHCGCSVQQIMTLRETHSWGQVAVLVGTDWATILAEVDGASLADPLVDVTKMEQSLHNGPMPTPQPKPQVYVPVSDYIVPPPTGGTCP